MAAESARLLGVLIRSAPKLVLPYTAPVLRALVGKLRAAGSSAAAANAATAQPNMKASSQGGQGWVLACLLLLLFVVFWVDVGSSNVVSLPPLPSASRYALPPVAALALEWQL